MNHFFRINGALMYKGEAYISGHETRLVAAAPTVEEWGELIHYDHLIPLSGEQWYKGPHADLLRENGLYTVNDVQRAIEEDQDLDKIGQKRRKDIVDFLTKLD